MNELKEHKFNKNLGQNFITDTNLLSAIVSDAEVTSDDCVLEVGAGAGTLTEALAKSAKKVLSYEIDKSLADILNKKLKNCKNVEIVFADAIRVPNEEIYNKFNEPYKIVANLPYYITTPLIFKFLDDVKNIKSITIMVQKEVAERITASAGTKEYGAISAVVQFFFNTEIKRIINRNMFYPVPEVDSAVLNLKKIDNNISKTDFKIYNQCVKAAFAMRRKTLVNNLFEAFEISKVQAAEVLKKCGFSENVRGEMLTVQDFITLANEIKILL